VLADSVRTKRRLPALRRRRREKRPEAPPPGCGFLSSYQPFVSLVTPGWDQAGYRLGWHPALAQQMSNATEQSDDDRKRKQTRVKFLNREAAEVYLLLDFLSGRADRSLRPTSEEQAGSLLQDQLLRATPAAVDSLIAAAPERKCLDKQRLAIEADLKDPTRLVIRTMEIKYPIGEGDEDFEVNAAFLMRARDVLNTRASPATGATIAFTSMMSGQRSKIRADRGGDVSAWEFAESAYPWLMPEADKLARWIYRAIPVMVCVLLLALTTSAYTAWGKILLDTLDAVRRDDGATQQMLLNRISSSTASNAPATASAVASTNCDDKHVGTDSVSTVCDRASDIKSRYGATYYELAAWELPLRQVTPPPGAGQDVVQEQKKTEQWSTAVETVLGNYVMPILYAFLGSLAFVLRRYYDRLAAHLLSPRDRSANSIRLLLGTLIGGCIGLVYSGSGAAQNTGILGMAVTLSTSAIAFLAGYGVDGVFKSLDAIITQVFRVNGTDKLRTGG